MSPKPNVLILRAPGTNCDQESGFAFEAAGAKSDYVHINALAEDPSRLSKYQVLCLPGGFSYGDDIAAGRILATRMQRQLGDWIEQFHSDGKLILGICNGFQILIKSGFLVPQDDQGLAATLTWNDNGRFVDKWVHLKTDNKRCIFLRGIEHMYLPIAHAEGKFMTRTDALLQTLTKSNQLALKYCRPNGTNGEVPFPHNPNGSTASVAGVCDSTGRIFGLMPHPERHIDGTHHPQWTRRGAAPEGDGLQLFKNAVEFFA